MAQTCFCLLVSLISSVFIGVADASYCYNTYNYGSYSYYCYYYIPIGSIVGAVIGSLVGIATMIGLLVFCCCCIRPRRLAARGRVIQATASPTATVISTSTAASTAQMGGGYINTASYPPETQATYPQHSYPPQQQAPSAGYQPPPSYK